MMAKRIDEETKIKINELYREYGIKKKVAEELGISVSSVSKYLKIDNIPNNKKTIKIEFSISPRGSREFINMIKNTNFCEACKLTNEELEELVIFQKEYFNG